ncbi:glycosyltransferase family 2 protein [uncultured Rhodospira sp.]|uniref:glycosyltransferase family 2 protein n=1 Tax=uncultured Rhodospira sp. TaxID=1936189 RepID=UPI002621182F|nr:glycosyltransferase family 2 protein [uncultured Rhodospira sp.]
MTDTPAPSAPLVSVLMVSYYSARLARRALDHLAAQDRRDFEVVLVENGVGDGAWAHEEAARRAFPITVLTPPENLGFAAGNNLAARHARGPWLALLNPDAFPDPDWLSSLLAAAERHPPGTAFGSVQVNAAEPGLLDGVGDCWCPLGLAWRGGHRAPIETAPTEDRGVLAPCAAAALWARADFVALGGFAERYFCYMEDVDLALRHRLRGGRCVTVAAARVRHVGSGTTARHSVFGIEHDRRNALWTVVRTTPAAWFWPLLPLQALAHGLMLARAARHGGFGAAWRGLREGLAALPGPDGVWADRRAIQAQRTASLWTLARAVTWNPVRLLWRGAKTWPPETERGGPQRGKAHERADG